MNCQQCQQILDDLLVNRPDEANHAELVTHLDACPQCAHEHRLANQVLASLDLAHEFRASPELKKRILSAVSVDVETRFRPTTARLRQVNLTRPILAVGLAASLLLAGAFLLWSGPGGDAPVQVKMPAFRLISQAYAAEEAIFAGDAIVYIANQIVVKPVADPMLARMRWFPIMSLEATGKRRFHQLKLSAKPGEGYIVEDQTWYDPATGRFVRTLTADGRQIYANSYDGQAVYWLEPETDVGSRVVKRPREPQFQFPKSPAELLGIGAGLPSRFDERDKSLVSDAGEVKLDDGSTGRVVKLGFPEPDAVGKTNAYFLVTIRKDDNKIAKMEFVADEKSLFVVRRVKTENVKEPAIAWDLAGIVSPAGKTQEKRTATISPDMVVSGVSVQHMVEKAGFPTYIFEADPSWAGKRQITDVLDIVSPPRRMFAITYHADDGRHVVLVQSPTYNKMLGPMTKLGKLVYTSPSGVKVWSGPRDKWLAGILIQSARATIKDPPSENRMGYLLETPDGTYPALAINGQVTDKEVHGLIDDLVPAKR